ncbi:hypothetical protein [Pseudobacteriovorax antillogorgiicola]|uniref:Uncharacterized protein n=1 Tax=Pseudobacteriovorax antillogorgiicola TaxID=1513793 RepID=A0A1Y6BKX3_9BACT|nr:hypothetical protein [Pseudobacteriovorax antillogorgiicola]TCS54651.1 hypothetical protein EDD56_106164 [Pseudobacteriovorax antillogorgiicola]SMF16896.1 hypothetical protein SAMN06296036_10679 [Pseudobacteriovorax antillogorgiicola]
MSLLKSLTWGLGGLILCASWGCGTRVGNPMQSGSQGGTGGGGGETPAKPLVPTPPTLSLSFGNLLDGFLEDVLALQRNGGKRNKDRGDRDKENDKNVNDKNRIESQIRDIQEIAQSIDQLLETYQITDFGTFQGQGVDKKQKLKVSDLGEGKYEAVVCEGDKFITRIAWNEKADDIMISASNITLYDQIFEVVDIKYTVQFELESLDFVLADTVAEQFQNADGELEETDQHIEAVVVRELSSTQTLLQSVEGFTTDSPIEGIEYVTGVLVPGDRSQSVYVSYDENCNGSFNEANPAGSWCYSGNIFDEEKAINNAEAQAQWEVIKGLGILSKDKLVIPEAFTKSDQCSF